MIVSKNRIVSMLSKTNMSKCVFVVQTFCHKNCPRKKIALTALKTIFAMRGGLPLFTTALF